MKNHTLYITVRVDVESTLSLLDAVSEFETETDYSFGNTENVKVLDTEILEAFLKYTKN